MSVTIDIEDGKRILGIFPQYTRKEVARKVPGSRAKWDRTNTDKDVFIGWTYPLSMETCWTFRKVFGADLKVGNALAIWAREELSRRSSLEAFRDEDTAAAADILNFVQTRTPQLFLAISSRPYQITGAAFLVTAKGGLLGDEPGLGKTIQTIAALVQENSRRVLVSCPVSAKVTVWAREIQRWAPHMKVFVAEGSAAQREAIFEKFDQEASRPFSGGHPCVLVINPEMMRGKKEHVIREVNHRDGTTSEKAENLFTPSFPWLFAQRWDAIVMDESHNVLATTKNTMAKGISQWRLGAMKLRRCIREGGMAIALSGTPARSRLERFWGTLNWVFPEQFSSYWRFAETHFEVKEDGWGQVVGTVNEHGRAVAIPKDTDLFDRALRPYYLARTKAKAAPDLPPIVYAGTPAVADGMNCVWVGMDPKQAKAYGEMAKMATARVSGGTCLANGKLAEITRLRQLANAYGQMSGSSTMVPIAPSGKIDWIMQFLLERQEGNGKFIIASTFTEMVELTARTILADKSLSYQVATLTGNTSAKARAQMQERFQDENDPLRVIVVNSKAGGEAITLDRADDVIVIDLPWTSDEFTQLENRAHRVSRIHSVTVHRLASEGTIDEWMATLTDDQRAALLAARPERQAEMFKEAMK